MYYVKASIKENGKTLKKGQEYKGKYTKELLKAGAIGPKEDKAKK